MLTERKIRDAKTTGKTYLMRDSKVVGLAVRVAAGGTLAFVLDYRANGKRRLATLARVGEISLAEARTIAGRKLVEIRAGEADPVRDRAVRMAAPTVAEGIDKFLTDEAPRRIADGLMAERTLYTYRKQCAWLAPRLGTLKIAAVTIRDIERALASTAPVSRNRYLAILSRLFSYWHRIEWCAPEHNPAKLIEKAREEPRDRVLAPTELEALAGAVDRSDEVFAVAAIRFLMLTGWRSGEVLALQWEHVDFERGEVLLPSTKAGRQTRPIGAPALALIADLPKMHGNPFIFAGARGAAIGYRKLRTVFAGACEAAGLVDVRMHDLRRSVATMAAANGLPVLLLRDLLGHKSAVMANRYARRAGSALQVAVDASAERMAALMAGEAADVVPMERRRG